MHARSITGTQGTMLLIAISAAACTPLEHRSSDPAYVAEDIDVVAGTIKDKKLSELIDVKVVLSGLVKTSSGKRPLMYLSHDRSKIDEELAKNCIQLLIDQRLKFNSPKLSEFTFGGHFILLPRDPATVSFNYEGISFFPDCHAFVEVDQYPYFDVKSVRKNRAR